MSAKLIIQRSIAPPDLWHWKIIVGNQEWEPSKKSFKSAEECMNDALHNAVESLVAADKI